jgi:hypothetical protein
MNKREAVNYRKARFSEPDGGEEFDFVNKYGLRKALQAYLNESSSLYVFDPDHAIISYPLRALQKVGDHLLTAAIHPTLSKEEKHFLQSLASDKDGKLSMLLLEMKRIQLL